MTFDKTYLRHFAAHVLRDTVFLAQVAADLKPEFFSDDTLRSLVQICINHFKEHKAAPGPMVFQVLDSFKARELISEDRHKLASVMADDLFGLELHNQSYLLSEFDRFVRHQLFTTSAADITESFRRGDLDAAERLFKQVFAHRSSKQINLGREYTADPSARVIRRIEEESRRFLLLIPELDEDVDGLRPGEIGIWQSQRTSGGKSAALAFMARSALMQKLNTVVFTLEMTEDQYEDRIDQTIAGLRRAELQDASRIQQSAYRVMRRGGRLRIIDLPPYTTTISSMRKHVEMLREVENFHTDLVLIDYIGLVAPEISQLRGDLHSTAADVGSALLNWMKEEKLRCWTAAQSGRAVAADDGVATPEDIAGGMPMAQIAPIIISVNQSPEENGQGYYRFHIGKNRDGRARITKKVKCDLSRMQFYRYVSPDEPCLPSSTMQ